MSNDSVVYARILLPEKSIILVIPLKKLMIDFCSIITPLEISKAIIIHGLGQQH